MLGYSVYIKQAEINSNPYDAIIIDQLSSESSVSNFTEVCNDFLKKNGYKVKVVKGENVTVNFFIDSDFQYDLVILRTHSGVFDGATWLFTGEEYSNTKYIYEQFVGEVNIGKCPGFEYYVFTISPHFIDRVFKAKEGSIVFLMGCNSMDDSLLADVFHNKGSELVFGWMGPISLVDTDEATLDVLEAYVNGFNFSEVIDNVNRDSVDRDGSLFVFSSGNG